MNEALQANLVSQVWSRPHTVPAQIPTQADVVVIGGGIVGVSTAWFLARSGVDVVLCEKAVIACEQSSRNWGWVRRQGRDEREIELMIDSMRIWESLEKDIGESVGFEKHGCMFTASTDKQLQQFVDWLDIAKAYSIDTRVLDANEISTVIDGAGVSWKGALFTPDDARAEPHLAAPAIARAAERAGAKIVEWCAVRGVETAAGKVEGVVTEHGTIRASTVLCAGGAWTSMLCRSLGIRLPQLQVRGTVSRTAPGPDVLESSVFSDYVGVRRRQDRGYTVAHGRLLDHFLTPATLRNSLIFLPALIKEFRSLRVSLGREFLEAWRTPKAWDPDEPSPFESNRILNPAPNQRHVADAQKDLGIAFPALAGIEFVESWAGMVETTPDVIPVIDESPLPGFYIATGFSGHGFGIGPGAGRAAAELLRGDVPSVNIRALNLSRFSDGTPIRPQSAL